MMRWSPYLEDPGFHVFYPSEHDYFTDRLRWLNSGELKKNEQASYEQFNRVFGSGMKALFIKFGAPTKSANPEFEEYYKASEQQRPKGPVFAIEW